VVQQVDTNEQFAAQQPRCEIGEIHMTEGACQRLGEVRLDGRSLCVRHADLLELEEQSERMLVEVFEMDQWLDSVDGQADELRVRRAEHDRNELVEQLRFNRVRMEIIRDEFYKRRTMMD
jgi:hypothetical protein